MCGIAGILSNRPREDFGNHMESMNQAIHHRGPDEDGIYHSENYKIWLSHKRLSIIDLASGQQPMISPDGQYSIVFNGEIYNHGEIRKELENLGYSFNTHSDTEVLLKSYSHWKEDCLQRLRGMFAFCVYNNEDGSLFLARDRLGIKPLYYGKWDNSFIFASECKAILKYPGFPRDINYQAMSDYFSLMYIPAPKSIYQNIRKLRAGHWLKVNSKGELKEKAYWDISFEVDNEYNNENAFEKAQEDLLIELENSIKLRMISDVPIGSFLSGGVDSSAVVALMSKNSESAVNTHTIGFDVNGYGEQNEARKTADFFKTNHFEKSITPEAAQALNELSWYFDEPFADSSMIPTYYVCKAAREKVTVALSGDGGDENFAGYRRYYFDNMEQNLRQSLPKFSRDYLIKPFANIYPKADWLPQPLRAKTMLTNLSVNHVEGYFRSMSHFLPEMKQELFSTEMAGKLNGYNSLNVFEEHYNHCDSRDGMSKIQYLDMKTYLVDDILTKVDRASMAVSLEVRVPILDHKFMELAAKFPSHWKLKGKESKYIFKKSLQKILPEEIFSRPKTGFSIPLKEWLRKDLKNFCEEHIGENSVLSQSPLFNSSYISKLIKEHNSGIRDHSYPIFALISFSLWSKQHNIPLH